MPGGGTTSTRAVRDPGIDVARVLGLGSIVASHTWEGDRVEILLFSWNVPLFFLLTGYLWRSRRSLADETRRRTRSLVVPYVCWYLIVAGVWFGYQWLADDDPDWPHAAETLLGGAHAGRPFSAFWFVSALFVACVLLRATERYPRWVPWLVGLVGLGACHRAPDAMAALPYSVGPAVACMLFIMIGMELRRFRADVPAPLATGLALMGGGLLAFGLGVVDTIDIKPGDFGSPILSVVVSAAISIGIVLVCEVVVARLPRPLVAPAEPVARAALAVVLGHALLLAFVFDGPWDIGNRYAVFALAFAVSALVGLVLLRTPLRRVLL